jgi:hypothetical protein
MPREKALLPKSSPAGIASKRDWRLQETNVPLRASFKKSGGVVRELAREPSSTVAGGLGLRKQAASLIFVDSSPFISHVIDDWRQKSALQPRDQQVCRNIDDRSLTAGRNRSDLQRPMVQTCSAPKVVFAMWAMLICPADIRRR